MIFISYVQVEKTRAELLIDAKRAFPASDNDAYINEIGKRKNESSAIESLTALLVLSELVRAFGIEPDRLILSRTENGKPFFKNSRLDFSISHSHGMVAVALSDSGKIGIDVEASNMTNDKAKKLSERYFGNADVTSTDDFLKLWVHKESYVKLCGSTLAQKIKSDIPKDVNFYDFEVFSHPASLCCIGENTIEILMQ